MVVLNKQLNVVEVESCSICPHEDKVEIERSKESRDRDRENERIEGNT